MDQKYQIMNEPDWYYEAIACLEARTLQAEEDMIANHERYGLEKTEIETLFAPLIAYKKQIWKETEPLLASYAQLTDYWQKSEDEVSLFHALLLYVRNLFQQDVITDEEIDLALQAAYLDLLSEYGLQEGLEKLDLEILLTNIPKTTLTDKDKMRMITFYASRQQVVRDMKTMLTQVAQICQNYASGVEGLWQLCVQELQVKKSPGIPKLVLTSLDVVHPTIFRFNSAEIISINEHIVLYFGVLVDVIDQLKKRNRFHDVQLIAALKALSDPTRMKILQLISQSRLYLQEIADQLHLTPATISHHIGLLGQSDFLIFHVDQPSRKLYYELNRRKLEELGMSLVALAGKELDE